MKRSTPDTLFSAAAASVLLLTAACGGSGDPAGPTPSSSASSETPSNATYKDGQYAAKGSYPNPGGTSSVTVTLTLTDNAVTALDVKPGATSSTSERYQSQFVSGIEGEVVGKKIDTLKVSKVSGSSLTSGGFNQAIDQIKADAAE